MLIVQYMLKINAIQSGQNCDEELLFRTTTHKITIYTTFYVVPEEKAMKVTSKGRHVLSRFQ